MNIMEIARKFYVIAICKNIVTNARREADSAPRRDLASYIAMRMTIYFNVSLIRIITM